MFEAVNEQDDDAIKVASSLREPRARASQARDHTHTHTRVYLHVFARGPDCMVIVARLPRHPIIPYII